MISEWKPVVLWFGFFWSWVRFFPRFIPTTVAPAPVSRRHSRNSPKESSRTAPSRPQPPTQPPQPPKALCRGTRTRNTTEILHLFPHCPGGPHGTQSPAPLACFGSGSWFGPALDCRGTTFVLFFCFEAKVWSWNVHQCVCIFVCVQKLCPVSFLTLVMLYIK